MTEAKHPAGQMLQAFRDGELDPATSIDVSAHCEQCEICRAELAELEQLGRILAGDPIPELPRTVWHRIRPERRRESRLRPTFALAAAAAGILLGALIGPLRFSVEEADTEPAWTETATVWNGEATSPLLAVYESGQE